MLHKTPIALAVAALLYPHYGYADETEQESSHDHRYERIIVTASPLDKAAIDSAQPIYVMSDDELRRFQAATLGETLRSITGVQATYFSPTSSSPVIRGLDGPRVQIVQNGLDVADISRGGPDHAVTTESSTAQQIEVFRGPSTLLFGSGASGGVVNVVDNRVPRTQVEGIEGYYGANYASAAGEETVNAGLTAGSGNFVMHIDGFKRHADDYRVPSFIDTDGNLQTRIENSFTEDLGYNLGASYFFDRGFFGFSYGRLERDYGIPGHSHDHGDDHDHGHSHDHDHGHNSGGHGHDDIFASFQQDRYQVIGSILNPMQGIERLDLNFGYTELVHNEIEDNIIESGFSLEQTEFRATAKHAPIWGWNGAVGVQLKEQDYKSEGVEAFTPASTTELAGLFWLVERQFGDVTLEAGARIEQVELFTDRFASLKYTPTSVSFGAVYRANDALKYNVSVSYSERAPQANELFANGAHFATRTYEVGGVYEIHGEHDQGHNDHGHSHDHDDHGHSENYHLATRSNALTSEQSTNFDVGVHYKGQRFHLDANLFYNRINDFIFQYNTGILSEALDSGHDHGHNHDHGHSHDHDHSHDSSGLPVYVYQQQDAELYGFEISGHYELTSQWHLGAFTDYTRAKFLSGGNVPRIPAQRVGVTLSYYDTNWDTQLAFTRYMKQDRISDNEEVTEGFGLVNAYLNYYPGIFKGQDISIYVKAENITNQLGYAHNSFIKDYAPLPGRNIGIGVRARF